MNILLVKTSSLGDVVHSLPAVNDVHRILPEAHIDWCVEAAYAEIPRLHPGVRRVIDLDWRRWRRRLWDPATWREIRLWRSTMRKTHYDAVIDTQGLLKSALFASQSIGRRLGYDAASAREPVAALFYQQNFSVDRGLHAVLRNRRLVSAALSSVLKASSFQPLSKADEAAPDYGLNKNKIARDALSDLALSIDGEYAVLFTASSRADKLWAEDNWIALCRRLLAAGITPVLPSGSKAEQARAQRIASVVDTGQVRVPAHGTLTQLAALLAGTCVCVGVDTGLTHLAASLQTPVLAIYCQSNPGLTGVFGCGWHQNLGACGHPPDVDTVWDTLWQAGLV